MQIYLDCDGVLANFNKKALEIFEVSPREFEDKYGTTEFWKRSNNTHDFYFVLEVMEDARELYDAVKHLKPIILTGVSSSNIEKSSDQKIRWAHKVFGEDQKVICCFSKDKNKYCNSGDILIDDWSKYKHLWEEKGGIFILHTSAQNSIAELKNLNVIQ